jgi:UDP-N-acetyl-D-glucosamine dehydrogenase
MDLLEKIGTRKAVVSVVGLGYVGLPLAVAFAQAGFRVVGIDVSQERVDSINRGESQIPDISPEAVAQLVSDDRGPTDGSLSATTDYDALGSVDAVIICVPTPLSKTRDPDVSHIVAAADEVAGRLHPGMLVVLESTTYPGATEELILPRLKASSDGRFQIGKDFFLAFSPERIDPGRTDWTISNTPKVIGGLTVACGDVAQALYRWIVEEMVPVSSPRVAEMVKLLENTFRATNIALVNETAIMCERLGVDVWEVIEAAGTKPFGFMTFFPGPGLGGHCIPVDPQYLAWKLKTLNYNARFIQLAEEINFGMPAYVLGRISEALNEDEKPLKGSKVLVLGVTYKADIGDLREAPALDLIQLLQEKGTDVAYHDPYVPSFDVDGLSMHSVQLDEEVLASADCVVVTTAHSSYDWTWVVNNTRLLLDTRNAARDVSGGCARVVRL